MLQGFTKICEAMDKVCKNCQFYKASHGYKYGDCEQVVSLKGEELGLKRNPARVYDRDKREWINDSYMLPSYLVDENSTVNLNTIIWHSNGDYDAMSVGENFGCIHFQNKTTN